jgi:hypothetical protein
MQTRWSRAILQTFFEVPEISLQALSGKLPLAKVTAHGHRSGRRKKIVPLRLTRRAGSARSWVRTLRATVS